MFGAVALAWVSWLGLAVSLIGLIFTFREARHAKIAAEKAGSEVMRVMGVVRSRTRLAAFTLAVAQADMIVVKIEKDALRSSQETFTGFRRVVREAVETTFQESRLGEIPSAEVYARLEAIAKLISAKIEQKPKKVAMLEAFHDVQTFLINQEARARQEDVG